MNPFSSTFQKPGEPTLIAPKVCTYFTASLFPICNLVLNKLLHLNPAKAQRSRSKGGSQRTAVKDRAEIISRYLSTPSS